MPDEHEKQQASSIRAYVQLLLSNRIFRILWLGEVVNNLGSWLNLIACLTLVERLDSSKIDLSFVILIRFFPFLFWSPVAGVVADRYRRDIVLLVSCSTPAIFVSCLALIHRAQDLWALYVLLFLQFSLGAFYDPARRALLPQIVPRSQLHLATTIDSWSWSLMSAVGSSLGGLAASKLGSSACYLLDALSYLIAAFCAYLLLGKVPGPKDPALWQEKAKVTDDLEVAVKHAVPDTPIAPEERLPAEGSGLQAALDEEPLRHRQHAAAGSEADGSEDQEQVHLAAGVSKQAWSVFFDGITGELAALTEGYSYMLQPGNRDVAAFTLLKGSGALVWGAADVLNVLFAAMPSMLIFGDHQLTLGFVFAGVGLGCFFGPIGFNLALAPEMMPMLLACVISYALMAVSWIGFILAPNIYLIILSTILRSVGSAVVWVYSTLLLQIRVPNALLGRMLAVEMAFHTATEMSSGLFAGVALDHLHLSVYGASGVMAFIAVAVTIAWTAVYAFQRRSISRALYEPVTQHDREAELANL